MFASQVQKRVPGVICRREPHCPKLTAAWRALAVYIMVVRMRVSSVRLRSSGQPNLFASACPTSLRTQIMPLEGGPH